MENNDDIVKSINSSTAEQLRQIVEKIERLEQEKAEISEYVRDAFSEAKSNGFDVKALRQIIKLRKMDKDDVLEQETILETYRSALGMI